MRSPSPTVLDGTGSRQHRPDARRTDRRLSGPGFPNRADLFVLTSN
ncbi:hypothetical protein SAMN05216276_106838 [Streptosporangium subroseum]|uniref:Uncharacterized protein n=1 Tax=Streptosporangium subroseum TaxID=106412 RepID=A0A239NTW2_9ACTN|nr:hypothetical protein [Streptosporangium subroseum]SNT58122.1 hypothetical protein SAMN05216276_106838 [Streptosporangium subroseum]